MREIQGDIEIYREGQGGAAAPDPMMGVCWRRAEKGQETGGTDARQQNSTRPFETIGTHGLAFTMQLDCRQNASVANKLLQKMCYTTRTTRTRPHTPSCAFEKKIASTASCSSASSARLSPRQRVPVARVRRTPLARPRPKHDALVPKRFHTLSHCSRRATRTKGTISDQVMSRHARCSQPQRGQALNSRYILIRRFQSRPASVPVFGTSRAPARRRVLEVHVRRQRHGRNVVLEVDVHRVVQELHQRH